jgi:manganese/zinc/iron transport system permease protein
MSDLFVQLSLAPIMISVLAAVSCTLVGNFLLLRRQSLVGDAISHVVLLGIVGAFLVTGGTNAPAMLAGAAVSAVVAAFAFEAVRRLARVEAGAAMGVVFTTMFAAGVLLLEQSGARSAHLDVEHALYGNVESLIWLEASGWRSLFDIKALAALPGEFWLLLFVTLLVALVIALLFKELKLATFDPDHARALGVPAAAIGFLIVVAGALAAVAAFSAVGSILVIAMFIGPAAAARLLTDDLATQLWLSSAIAAACAVLGYALGAFAPTALGFPSSLSAAGMIAVCCGVAVAIAAPIGRARGTLRGTS